MTRVAVVDYQQDLSHDALTKRFKVLSFELFQSWEAFDEATPPEGWEFTLIHFRDYVKNSTACRPRHAVWLLGSNGTGDDVEAAAWRERGRKAGLIVGFSGDTAWSEYKLGDYGPFLNQQLKLGRFVYLTNLDEFDQWWRRISPLEEAKVELLHARLRNDATAEHDAWETIRREAPALYNAIDRLRDNLVALRAKLFEGQI